MEFSFDAGCGRSVIATRAYRPGDVVHTEAAYALCRVHPAQSSNAVKRCCNNCFLQIPLSKASHGNGLVCSDASSTSNSAMYVPQTCPKCREVEYCSAKCELAHAREHDESGECAALAGTILYRNICPREDFNTFQVVTAALARGFSEGRRDEALGLRAAPSTTSDATIESSLKEYVVETVGLGFEGPLPSFDECVVAPCGSTSTSVRSATFTEVQRLVTNRSCMSEEIRADYEKLFPLYERMLRRGRKESAWWASRLPENVSADVFVSLCCAFQANGFGVWNATGRGVAAGLFPCSSFFNHSCAPNIGRAMSGRVVTFFAAKAIAAGEPVCLSYVDFKLPREDRVAKLFATYSFVCRCPRCSDPDALDHRERYDLSLCEECKSKILWPSLEEPTLGTCPCCGATMRLSG